MALLKLSRLARTYVLAMILAHLIGLLLMAWLNAKLGMSWRAPGHCLSIPGYLLLIGLMPAVAFATTRIYAWWRAIVPGINAINRDTSKET